MFKKILLLVFLIGTVFYVSTSNAALLGLKLGVPDILSDSTGTYEYNVISKLMKFIAIPLNITFDGNTLIPISGNRSYKAEFYVDNNGNFLSGVDGNDLEIYGDIDIDNDGYLDYTGLLVGGEVTDFGWEDVNGPYALFDFSFNFTGGALESFYAKNGYHGGNFITSDNSNFTGSWQTNHSGTKVKIDTAPVPEPATMGLMFLGIGLFGFVMCFRKIGFNI